MNDTSKPAPAAAAPPIDSLDVPQLETLRTRIDDRVRELRENGQAQLLAQLETDCARLGFSLKDICSASNRRKRGRKAKNTTPEA